MKRGYVAAATGQFTISRQAGESPLCGTTRSSAGLAEVKREDAEIVDRPRHQQFNGR